MLAQFRSALITLILFTLITGVLYPLLVTGLAQLLLPHQANGSIVMSGDRAVGSALIGQSFDNPRYFWGRLSATSPAYNAGASSGSNYGPLNSSLAEAAQARLDALRQADPTKLDAPPPVDLATSSGSGLDPHISPAAADYQAPRVAGARGMSETAVRELIGRFTEGRTLGVLGEPRVNVLLLNLALDERAAKGQ